MNSIDLFVADYNSFLKEKLKIKNNDLNKLYKEFRNDTMPSNVNSMSTSSLEHGHQPTIGIVLENSNKKKKKKTAYQNFFTQTRSKLTEKNDKIPFGELSRLISSEWKKLSTAEKKKYTVTETTETHFVDDVYDEEEETTVARDSTAKKKKKKNLEDFFLEDNLSDYNSDEETNLNRLELENEFSDQSCEDEDDVDDEDDESIVEFNFDED